MKKEEKKNWGWRWLLGKVGQAAEAELVSLGLGVICFVVVFF